MGLLYENTQETNGEKSRGDNSELLSYVDLIDRGWTVRNRKGRI